MEKILLAAQTRVDWISVTSTEMRVAEGMFAARHAVLATCLNVIFAPVARI
jgi:hypothetical protein